MWIGPMSYSGSDRSFGHVGPNVRLLEGELEVPIARTGIADCPIAALPRIKLN
jgi:hypothetical protein